MPELAEVETVRRVLLEKLKNKKILDIKIIYSNIIENDLSYFKKNIIGQKIIDIKRRGKYLIFELEDFYLISHLRMEGKFFIKNNEEILKHEHIIFYFDEFNLRYHDTRKFGRMKLITKDFLDKYFSNLGPDANACRNSNYLFNKIHNKKVPIKTLLLDQSIIAGLGNIYVDEVLFMARINPFRHGNSISKNDCDNILKYAKIILDNAIKNKGTTIRTYTSSLNVKGNYQNFLKVHTKEKCLCGSIITIDRIGGRSTYYCNECQK